MLSDARVLSFPPSSVEHLMIYQHGDGWKRGTVQDSSLALCFIAINIMKIIISIEAINMKNR